MIFVRNILMRLDRFARFTVALWLAILCSCYLGRPVPVYTLPAPASLPSATLIPEDAGAAFIPEGATLDRDAVCLEPPLAAGIAAELERLDGRAPALQMAERARDLEALEAANRATQDERRRALRMLGVALGAGLGAAVIGVEIGRALPR